MKKIRGNEKEEKLNKIISKINELSFFRIFDIIEEEEKNWTIKSPFLINVNIRLKTL